MQKTAGLMYSLLVQKYSVIHIGVYYQSMLTLQNTATTHSGAVANKKGANVLGKLHGRIAHECKHLLIVGSSPAHQMAPL